ncbi:hypothetical protein L5515_002843 [Caenorhabditis briggsae]|uniref:Uncharacterized protein n=1 Tax=Caenorhabditis briggsae TaxID=6238 RepID=A0AAE9J5K2_CAEBR|nr:hypothetical protein L5515_002843 [Caenorhabditis briggsae]
MLWSVLKFFFVAMFFYFVFVLILVPFYCLYLCLRWMFTKPKRLEGKEWEENKQKKIKELKLKKRRRRN